MLIWKSGSAFLEKLSWKTFAPCGGVSFSGQMSHPSYLQKSTCTDQFGSAADIPQVYLCHLLAQVALPWLLALAEQVNLLLPALTLVRSAHVLQLNLHKSTCRYGDCANLKVTGFENENHSSYSQEIGRVKHSLHVFLHVALIQKLNDKPDVLSSFSPGNLLAGHSSFSVDTLFWEKRSFTCTPPPHLCTCFQVVVFDYHKLAKGKLTFRENGFPEEHFGEHRSDESESDANW